MAVRTQRWIEAQGFASNPFEYYEADNEREELSGYFVRPEWFDALRGDTQHPRSAVLFAPRGYGKSSHRIEIERICGGHTNYPAMIVSITEYDWLVGNGLEKVSSQRYLQYIVREALHVIDELLSKNASRRAVFEEDSQQLLQLYGLMRWADPHRAILFEQRLMGRQFGHVVDENAIGDDRITAMANYYQHTQQTEILRDLVQITRAAGFASLYVLVDRIDEDALTEHDVDAAVRILQPLISNLHLIEYPGVAFKFFLPDQLFQALQEQKVSRVGERVPTYTLHWGKADLLELLQRRLGFYSRKRVHMRAFQDVCEDVVDVDARLVAAAQGSPRNLILLAKGIIEEHCTLIDDAESKVSAATLSRCLGADTEPTTLITPTTPTTPSITAGRIPPLYLDPNGDIYFGNDRTSIRLTRLSRKLLEFLWQNRLRYVSKKEIEQALYEADTYDRTPHALYKVVTRLREQLEPNTGNSKNYVDFIEGTGYRLINCRND